jgi:hypothetical protein
MTWDSFIEIMLALKIIQKDSVATSTYFFMIDIFFNKVFVLYNTE